MVVSFFGHSNYSSVIGDEERLLSVLAEVVREERAEFYFEGYGRFDSFAFNCVKKYKEKNPNIELVYILPYLDKRLDKADEYDKIIYPGLELVPKNSRY